jgi:cytochrome b6-f complex iron-sulfur subunit
MEMQRRDFLKTTGTAVACACLGCAGLAQCADKLMAPPLPPDSYRVEGNKLIIDLNKLPKLQETGGWAATEVAGRKVIVLHPEEQQYKAFENKCPHKGGTCTYKHKEGVMQCVLHGSRFDMDGKVVKGPAQLPLHQFKASLDKTELTVELA